jgi:hypothetical protein
MILNSRSVVSGGPSCERSCATGLVWNSDITQPKNVSTTARKRPPLISLRANAFSGINQGPTVFAVSFISTEFYYRRNRLRAHQLGWN